MQRNHQRVLEPFIGHLILLGKLGSDGPRSCVVKLMLLGVEEDVEYRLILSNVPDELVLATLKVDGIA